MQTSFQGKLVIVSGPSASGKTTLLERLFARCQLPLVLSVSATTREPRPGEVDGVQYHFLDQAQFHRLREAGEFLECFEVHGPGHWYGTLRREVTPSLAEGKWVVLDIDVQGAQRILQQFADAITVFIRPSSIEELERRLRGRGTESEQAIQRRLESARHELAMADRYQIQVINDDLDRAVQELCDALQKTGG